MSSGYTNRCGTVDAEYTGLCDLVVGSCSVDRWSDMLSRHVAADRRLSETVLAPCRDALLQLERRCRDPSERLQLLLQLCGANGIARVELLRLARTRGLLASPLPSYDAYSVLIEPIGDLVEVRFRQLGYRLEMTVGRLDEMQCNGSTGLGRQLVAEHFRRNRRPSPAAELLQALCDVGLNLTADRLSEMIQEHLLS